MEPIDKDPMLKQVRAKANDKDHEVLYKSPGSERGENGRTWDWIQAKSKEEAAKLIADGWSVSKEEAYELEDALKASKKGKKKLVRKDTEETDEDEEEGEEEGDEEETSAQGDDLGLGSPKKGKKTAAKKKGKK